MLDQGEFTDPNIGLAQIKPHFLRQPHQPFARPVNKLGIRREHDVLRLNGRVHDHLPRILQLHRACLDGHGQALLQERADPFLAHALPPARHRGAVERQFVPKELLAAQVLKVGVLHPALAQRLVGQVERVLQNGQPRHQPRRQWRHASSVRIDRPKAGFQHRPVNSLRQTHKFVLHVDDLVEPGSE